MSKWIRGRRGRLIASTIIGMMLGSLMCSLTPLLADDQESTDSQGTQTVMKYFGEGPKNTTPLIVLDFENHSSYRTGMLGRMAADSLSLELLKTREFDVVPRAEVDQALLDSNLSLPITQDQQAQLAEKLKRKLVLSGAIDGVQVYKKREGTYAEVAMQVQVVSKLTRGAVNGARIVQRSSTKIGYSGNADALVQEAISTAAYQMVQQMLSHRATVATVLATQSEGGVNIRGGSAQGFKEGMELVTLRRNIMSGRLRIKTVNMEDSIAEVEEDVAGIAPGDKAVPIFVLGDSQAQVAAVVEPGISTAVQPMDVKHSKPMTYSATGSSMDSGKKADSEGMFMKIAALLAAAVLVKVIGSNGGRNTLDNPTSPTATPLADAVEQGEPSGANYVHWTGDSTKRVIAYLLYRSSNSSAPIAVLPGTTTHYIDSAKSFGAGKAMESIDWEIIIDPNQLNAPVRSFSQLNDMFDADTSQQYNANMSQTGTETFDVTSHRAPLGAGTACSYMVKTLYVEYVQPNLTDPAQPPTQYALQLSAFSPPSAMISVLSPPLIDANVYPVDGNFTAHAVPGASTYELEISRDSSFAANQTLTYTAMTTNTGDMVSASVNLNAALQSQKIQGATNLYWRIGALSLGQPAPVAMYDNSSNGYVFSDIHQLVVAQIPPASPFSAGRGQATPVGLPGKLPTATINDRGNPDLMPAGNAAQTNTGRKRWFSRQ